MKRNDYLSRALDALNKGRISEEAYDAMLMNADVFCDDDGDDDDTYGIPGTYAEIEYNDLDDPEAIAGARWDDMNYSHYIER